MSDPIYQQFEHPKITRKFLNELPERLEIFRDGLSVFNNLNKSGSAGLKDTLVVLNQEAHKLAGTAGSVGFMELTTRALSLEVLTANIIKSPELVVLEESVAELKNCMAELFTEANLCEGKFLLSTG